MGMKGACVTVTGAVRALHSGGMIDLQVAEERRSQVQAVSLLANLLSLGRASDRLGIPPGRFDARYSSVREMMHLSEMWVPTLSHNASNASERDLWQFTP